MMYDGVGSLGTPPEYFERLRDARRESPRIQPRQSAQGAHRLAREQPRITRKLVIVDGRVAFTGGINISNVYSSGSSRRSGRALPQCAASGSGGLSGVRSPVADRQAVSRLARHERADRRAGGRAAAALFSRRGRGQKGEALAQRKWYPPTKPQGSHPVRVIASGPTIPRPRFTCAALGHQRTPRRRCTSRWRISFPIRRRSKRSSRGGARRRRHPGLALVYRFLGGLSRRTFALRGSARSRRQDLRAAAGAAAFENAVIDGVWSTVGSSNMDWRSFLHNKELNVVILGWEFGRRWRRCSSATSSSRLVWTRRHGRDVRCTFA